MLISPAYAASAGSEVGQLGQWSGLLPIILMFALLYFMLIRPQMKRAKEHKTMTEGLQKGDEVISTGGVLGKITKVGDAYITMEIASGIEVHVQKGAVQTLLPKGTIKSL